MITLQPGDGIIYTGSNLFDGVEEIKLGSDATHFEVYIGDGKVVTSLMATGVGIYTQCRDEILRVLRPVRAIDIVGGLTKFKITIDGLPYGTKGLLNFTDNNVPDVGLFCSQVGTEFYRSCGFEPFNSQTGARKVAPMHYLYVSELVAKIIYNSLNTSS